MASAKVFVSVQYNKIIYTVLYNTTVFLIKFKWKKKRGRSKKIKNNKRKITEKKSKLEGEHGIKMN